MCKMYQDQMAKEREQEMEERRRVKEKKDRQKRFLEASFEGNNAELQAVLKEAN